MLFNLLVPYADEFGVLNLFRYLTFRTAGAVATSLILAFVMGPYLINWLRKLQPSGQPIRADGPSTHLIAKAGTPTMGGVLILICIAVATLLWADLTNLYVWVIFGLTLALGLLGFIDDSLKVSSGSSRGISARLKFLIQLIIALGATLLITGEARPALQTTLAVPFFKDTLIDLGYFFIPFGMFVIVGASNAVNLTDGLDGLAIVPVMVVCACLALIAYLTGNAVFASYLQIPAVPGAGEIAVLCGAMVGAGLGFLWFNAPPAMVFMGDTGSLALGGALGGISLVTKHELVLAVIGGLFVVETISVIIQVVFFKITGRRVFLMAPLHHHFEKKGWAEATIVIRFWIISILLALAGLTTLKLR